MKNNTTVTSSETRPFIETLSVKGDTVTREIMPGDWPINLPKSVDGYRSWNKTVDSLGNPFGEPADITGWTYFGKRKGNTVFTRNGGKFSLEKDDRVIPK